MKSEHIDQPAAPRGGTKTEEELKPARRPVGTDQQDDVQEEKGDGGQNQ